MLKFICAVIFFLATGVGTQAVAAGCEPGPNEATVFQDSNYRGACSVLSVGVYVDSAAMRIKNDSVSSIKVGANVEIVVGIHSIRGNTSLINKWLHNNKARGNFGQIFTESQRNLSKTHIGNDTISFAIVRAKAQQKDFEHGDCYPGDNTFSVAIYQHPKFKGNCRVLDLGTYSNSKQMNFKNDSASSVEFGRNSKVYAELFSDSNFKGRKQTLSGSVDFLSNGNVGDNKLTSIKVLRK